MTRITDSTVAAPDRSAVVSYIVELLEEITADWDVPELSGATELGSLGIDSINLVYLIAEVQAEFGLQDGLIRALRHQQVDIRRMRGNEIADLVREVASNGRLLNSEVKP